MWLTFNERSHNVVRGVMHHSVLFNFIQPLYGEQECEPCALMGDVSWSVRCAKCNL